MIQGALNVCKEKGYTSHDVVAKLRGMLGEKKIGHAGTLDPDATGVLPVLLGKATKASDLVSGQGKTYEATLVLGVETDTYDLSGRVIREDNPGGITRDEVEEALLFFAGGYAQVPPMYSAKKVGGKKLYKLAREGKTVERPARKIEIHEMKILQFDLPRVKILVDCSKGTYIRSLCHDIGQKLGCGGCMGDLVRTRSGAFTLQESVSLTCIEEHKNAGTLSDILIPLDTLFIDFPVVTVTDEGLWPARHGNPLPVSVIQSDFIPSDQEIVRLHDEKGRLIGLYSFQEEEQKYKVKKMFWQADEEHE